MRIVECRRNEVGSPIDQDGGTRVGVQGVLVFPFGARQVMAAVLAGEPVDGEMRAEPSRQNDDDNVAAGETAFVVEQRLLRRQVRRQRRAGMRVVPAYHVEVDAPRQERILGQHSFEILTNIRAFIRHIAG
jgi:hypothetical protein